MRIYGTVIAVIVALISSVVMASAAIAAPEWATYGPVWEQGGVALTEATATTWKGEIKVEDEKATGKPLIECEAGGEGSAGAGGAGSVSKLTFTKCVVPSGTCGSPSVTVVNLPWHTELSGPVTSVSDVLTGTPGYETHCTVFGIKIADKCTATTLKTSLENSVSGVNAVFGTEKLNCTLGGEQAGTLKGTESIEAVSGGKLSVGRGAASPLTGSLAVEGKGRLKINDPESVGHFYLTCDVTTTGTIESKGLGTISSYIVKNCETNDCGSASVKPIHLPWKTELSEPEPSVLKDSIVSGGSGTPSWEFTCNFLGTIVETVCSLETSPGILNLEDGLVEAIFSEEKTRVTCSHDSKSGTSSWEGKLTVAATNGQSIEAKP